MEHFKEAYDVEVPLEYLAEAMAQWSRGFEEVPTHFPDGDGIGALDESPAFTRPPPYSNSREPSSSSSSEEGGTNVAAAGPSDYHTPPAPSVSSLSPTPSELTLTPRAVAGDSGSQDSGETPEAEMTDYNADSSNDDDGDESVDTDDHRVTNYELSEDESSAEASIDQQCAQNRRWKCPILNMSTVGQRGFLRSCKHRGRIARAHGVA